MDADAAGALKTNDRPPAQEHFVPIFEVFLA